MSREDPRKIARALQLMYASLGPFYITGNPSVVYQYDMEKNVIKVIAGKPHDTSTGYIYWSILHGNIEYYTQKPSWDFNKTLNDVINSNKGIFAYDTYAPASNSVPKPPDYKDIRYRFVYVGRDGFLWEVRDLTVNEVGVLEPVHDEANAFPVAKHTKTLFHLVS
jgi:hypothetical protein